MFHKISDTTEAKPDCKCTECGVPAVAAHDGREMCGSCLDKDTEGGIAQAMEMADNMRKYSTIDKPFEPHLTIEDVCPAHNMVLSEGGYCAECERLGDLWVAQMDQAMKEQQYSLWVLCQKTHLFKVPVYNFNDAKTLYHSLNWDVVSGVRIARYCEQEGCEVVLHRFM